jgi:hypothetical protein
MPISPESGNKQFPHRDKFIDTETLKKDYQKFPVGTVIRVCKAGSQAIFPEIGSERVDSSGMRSVRQLTLQVVEDPVSGSKGLKIMGEKITKSNAADLLIMGDDFYASLSVVLFDTDSKFIDQNLGPGRLILKGLTLKCISRSLTRQISIKLTWKVRTKTP